MGGCLRTSGISHSYTRGKSFLESRYEKLEPTWRLYRLNVSKMRWKSGEGCQVTLILYCTLWCPWPTHLIFLPTALGSCRHAACSPPYRNQMHTRPTCVARCADVNTFGSPWHRADLGIYLECRGAPIQITLAGGAHLILQRSSGVDRGSAKY